MKQSTKKLLFRTALGVVIMVAAIIAFSMLLTSCTIFRNDEYATFSVKSLTLEVGESYDLRRVITGNTEDYRISVDTDSILKVSGKKITAQKVGRTAVSVITKNSDDTITVTVKEAEPTTFTIQTQGQTIQTVGQASTVVFTANATGTLRGESVDWYVNNVKQNLPQDETVFSFMPEDAGVFTIEAKAGKYSAQSVVRAYYSIEAVGAASGVLNQLDGEITAITLTATAATDLRNPTNYIEWVVDGKTLYEGENTSFRYVPSIGTHVVELYVNGVKRLIGGQSSVTVRAAGQADAPTVTGVTFDNVYPHVYVEYEGADNAQVEIIAPNGLMLTYRQSDDAVASKFSDGRFDAQGVISTCAMSSSRGTYRIRAKALGDGDLIKASEYSETFSFVQLPPAAKKYLETSILDFDLYLTDEEDYIDVLEYYVLGRSKTASRPKVEFSCYIAFDMTKQSEAESLFYGAFEWAATSGSYNNISVKLNSNVMTTSFNVSTINRPTRQSYDGNNDYEYAVELHAIAPHINYDEAKYRPANYVFPIDLAERTESVSYTDELYFAVEHNTRPIPESGSAADTVYQKAREALRMIVTDEMSDVEKAHAIYDWIMWKVTYDTPATEVSRNGEAYSAYYLEGVFGDGSTYIKDVSTGKSVAYYPYAVCDGLSKAYTLMCNIEGVPCVRVAGMAGDSLLDAGGHAWNKVYVNGGWYLVDITWGDSQGRIDRTVYELSLHDWLFLTDEQADPTHFEPYESGDSYLIKVPETTTAKLDIYKEMTYYGVEINCSVGRNENQSDRLEEIILQFAKNYSPRSSLYVPGCGTSATPYSGFDIRFEDGMKLTESNASSIVRSAFRRYVPSATVETYLTSDDVLIVLIS